LEEYASKKAEFRERSTLLREAGHAIKNDELYNQGKKGLSRAEKREMAETLHRFENAVYMLKKDFVHTETAFKLRGGNPFIPYLKLLMAIIGGSMSLMWIIHICVFILPPKPADPLLNTLFIKLSIPGFPLFGVCAFGLYVGWLLFAVMKGNFRVGLRIACCRVFPMEYNNTLTNAFLANSWLILLCSFVVVQFSAIAFPIYARNSTVDLIFGTQIRYMRFFTYFFANNVFIICFLVFAFLGVLWMILCPRDDGARIEGELQKAMSGKKITKRHIEMAGK
jgi:LMBR1 domain-containing protein 1